MYDLAEAQICVVQSDNAKSSNLPVQTLAIDSSTLFNHNDVVYIQHHGECYMLRRTRNDKLILTK